MDNSKNELELKKKGNSSIITIVILSLLVLVLGGYIIYEKITPNSNNTSNNTNKESNQNSNEKVIKYNAYNVGDKVTAKLNDSIESTFYVLKQSSETDENVTLFAEKNIGTSAFNTDFTDGNEYKGSLIESKLNELTTSWTNIKEKRLITVDEINATGLTNKERCGPSENDLCDTVKENSWLKYKNEFYWTMTKAESNGNIQYDKGKYIYYVDLGGSITGHIVGYKPGGEWNENGTAFDNFGIRPVIEISKEYIK
ncbi:MAG: hypothetical protein Q4E39_06220 [bacterium]|nr:hypothetical protein [bacterium]